MCGVIGLVCERTRGDLTLAIRQDQMRAALHEFGSHLDQRLGTQFASAAEELVGANEGEIETGAN